MLKWKTEMNVFFHFPSEKSQGQLDVAFVVGASAPQAEKVFNYEKDIVKAMIDQEQPIRTRYGLITYTNQADTRVSFDDFRDKTNLKQFIDFIRWSEAGVALDDGLEKASELFREASPLHSRKVLVVFVNARTGVSKADLKAKSRKLLDSGVNVLVVSIGNNVDSNEVATITERPENVIPGTPTDGGTSVVDKALKILTADPCVAVDCPYYGVCVIDQRGSPSCACPTTYSEQFVPICGTDLKTYSNLEAMKVAACKAQKDISQRTVGKCGTSLL